MNYWKTFFEKIENYLMFCESQPELETSLCPERSAGIKTLLNSMEEEVKEIFEVTDSFYYSNPLKRYIRKAKIDISDGLPDLKLNHTHGNELGDKFELIVERLKMISQKWKSTGRHSVPVLAGMDTRSIEEELFQSTFQNFIKPIFEFHEWYLDEIEKVIDNKPGNKIVDSLTQQVNFLYKLGVVEFLKEKYPYSLKENNIELAELISQILRVENKKNTITPILNSLNSDNPLSKSYPANSKKIEDKINKLTRMES